MAPVQIESDQDVVALLGGPAPTREGRRSRVDCARTVSRGHAVQRQGSRAPGGFARGVHPTRIRAWDSVLSTSRRRTAARDRRQRLTLSVRRFQLEPAHRPCGNRALTAPRRIVRVGSDSSGSRRRNRADDLDAPRLVARRAIEKRQFGLTSFVHRLVRANARHCRWPRNSRRLGSSLTISRLGGSLDNCTSV
jgi:hypothetical protein